MVLENRSVVSLIQPSAACNESPPGFLTIVDLAYAFLRFDQLVFEKS
jgi:hypothetical protein